MVVILRAILSCYQMLWYFCYIKLFIRKRRFVFITIIFNYFQHLIIYLSVTNYTFPNWWCHISDIRWRLNLLFEWETTSANLETWLVLLEHINKDRESDIKKGFFCINIIFYYLTFLLFIAMLIFLFVEFDATFRMWKWVVGKEQSNDT